MRSWILVKLAKLMKSGLIWIVSLSRENSTKVPEIASSLNLEKLWVL